MGLLKGLVSARGDHTIQIYLFEENRASIASDYSQLSGVELVVIPNSFKKAFRNQFLEKLVFAFKASAVIAGAGSFFRIVHNFQWRRAARIIGTRSDITIYPHCTLPTFDLKSRKLLCLHDLQQVHFPQFFTMVERHMRRIRYGLSVQGSDYIQASSNF